VKKRSESVSQKQTKASSIFPASQLFLRRRPVFAVLPRRKEASNVGCIAKKAKKGGNRQAQWQAASAAHQIETARGMAFAASAAARRRDGWRRNWRGGA